MIVLYIFEKLPQVSDLKKLDNFIFVSSETKELETSNFEMALSTVFSRVCLAYSRICLAGAGVVFPFGRTTVGFF